VQFLLFLAISSIAVITNLVVGFSLALSPAWDRYPLIETTAQVMAVATVAVYSFLSHKWLTFAHDIRFQESRLGRLVVRWPGGLSGAKRA
jgi:hypothetical protein